MGKPSAPQPPAAPTAKEISEANVDTAFATARLQKAMQFGGEVMKDGYVREELGIPQGAERVYETQIIKQDAPETIGYPTRYGTEVYYKVNEDGKLEWADNMHAGAYSPGWFKSKYEDGPLGEHIGKSYYDFIEENPKAMRQDGGLSSDGWSTDGSRVINTPVKTLSGYRNSDGTITEANQYFKIDEDGNRTAVSRDEAVQADFTGMSDTDLARKQWEFEQETSPERTEFFLDQLEQFGPDAARIGRDILERTDPTGFAARELLGNLAQSYKPADVPDAPAMQEIGDAPAAERISAPPTLQEVAYTPEYQRAGELGALERAQDAPQYLESEYGPSYERAGELGDLRRVGEAPQFAELGTTGPQMERAAQMAALERSQAAPSLERLDDIPQMEIDPDSLGARRFAEGQYLDRAQSGRTADLMADEARRIARTRAAATGNIFGGGALIEEARAVRQAEDAGQRQALSDLIGFLQSGQTASDYESRIAQQNLANRLMGIQQRTGAEQAEFGMGQQVTGQRNQAAMQERADELAALGQRNQAEQQEFQNLQSALAQINQARQTQLGAEIQAAGFDNAAQMQGRADELAAIGQRNQAQEAEFQNLQTALNQINQARQTQFATGMQAAEFDTQQTMRERADELAAMAQRNQAQESEYQNLLQGLQQQQNARTAGFGMQQQAVAQRNQAAEADFAKQQSALAQRNQARQQSFANAMQRTATQQQMQQQQMANLQSFSGLAPVSQQFGGMAGAGQGMQTTFNPIQYQPSSAAQMMQAQQQLQGNLFGTQSQNWATQAGIAAQPSGFGQILGTVAGSFAGGVGEKAGAKWFN